MVSQFRSLRSGLRRISLFFRAVAFAIIQLLLRPLSAAPPDIPLTVLDRRQAYSEGYETVESPSIAPTKPTFAQLFLDLFFVANLATFNAAIEVNSLATLGTFTGFVHILWSCWAQITLYDTRFGSETVGELLFKFLQLVGMLGLAFASPAYSTLEINEHAIKSVKLLVYVLIYQRVLLALQYFFSGSRYKRAVFKHARRVTWGHGIIMSIVAVLLLGISYTFNTINGMKNLWVIHLLLVLELVAILKLSLYNNLLAFDHHFLGERFELLTLIIIGEGIIGMCEYSHVLGKPFSQDTVVSFIATLFIVCCMWYYRFGREPSFRKGSFRILFWIMLQLPYQLSILYLQEGANQLMLWRKLHNLRNEIGRGRNMAELQISHGSTMEDIYAVSNSLKVWFEDSVAKISAGKTHHGEHSDHDVLEKVLNKLAVARPPNNTMVTKKVIEEFNVTFVGCVADAYASLLDRAASAVHITIPPSSEAMQDSDLSGVLALVAFYFQLGAGLVLISTASLNLLADPARMRIRSFRFLSKMGGGCCFCLIALLQREFGHAASNIMQEYESKVMLPLVACVLVGIAVMEDNIANGIRRIYKQVIRDVRRFKPAESMV